MKESDTMKRKVMFISSTGGHLTELLQLDSIIKKYDYSLITEGTKANNKLKKKYKNVNFLLYGTKDHKLTYPFKLFSNCFISIFI